MFSRSRKPVPTLSNSASRSAIHLPTGLRSSALPNGRLRAGTTLAGVLELVRRIRQSSQVPLVLFSYYNPILQMGLEKFASTAASAGADGGSGHRSDAGRIGRVSPHFATTSPRHHFLGAPTSTDERMAKNRRLLLRISLPYFAHWRYKGAKGCTARRSPSALRRARSATKLPSPWASAFRFRAMCPSRWPR